MATAQGALGHSYTHIYIWIVSWGCARACHAAHCSCQSALLTGLMNVLHSSCSTSPVPNAHGMQNTSNPQTVADLTLSAAACLCVWHRFWPHSQSAAVTQSLASSPVDRQQAADILTLLLCLVPLCLLCPCGGVPCAARLPACLQPLASCGLT